MSRAAMDVDTGSGGAAGAQNGQDMSKRQGLISVNDLNYVLEPDLSVAVNKTHKKHFFQNASYTSQQRAICILNSGADYIDTTRSYLSFRVKPTFTATCNVAMFGSHGSVCNVIDNITISTRSGDELCRITEFGLYQNMLLPIHYNEDWFKTHGELMGFGGAIFKENVNDIYDDTVLTRAASDADVHRVKVVDLADMSTDNSNTDNPRFVIPMYILAPLFGYGRLMPAMLMSGLRIEIGWATPSKSFMAGRLAYTEADYSTIDNLTSIVSELRSEENGITAYEIDEPYFSLASVQLSDSIQRALNEQSATNGLEIVYCDYEKTDAVMGGTQKQWHVEVRKSCSRALKAFARIRQHSTTGVSESIVDSFKSETLCPLTQYQWQLGSLYFPQQPVKNSGIMSTAKEMYMHLLETVDKWHPGARAPLVTFSGNNNVQNTLTGGFMGGSTSGWNWGTQQLHVRNEEDGGVLQTVGDRGIVATTPYCTFAGPGGFVYDQHVIGVTLERSTMFNLAGVPVNNSRVLALHCELSSGEKQSALEEHSELADLTDNNSRRQLSIFLKYVKLARVFLNNVEVEQ